MSRTAESTIKGFLYQFNKTILSIANSADGDIITVEGLVEDIDVIALNGTTLAIQCKYHESVETFSHSLIYKPILQMAENFAAAPSANVSYRIFLHVPNAVIGPQPLTQEALDSALATDNASLKKIVARIPGFHHPTFLARVIIEFGPSIDELEKEVKIALGKFNINGADCEAILYPNALSLVAKLSSTKMNTARTISREVLINQLRATNSTAVTKWALASKSREHILKKMRNQLADACNANSRERHLYFASNDIADFDDGIVVFISTFVQKYSSKVAHTKTPLIAIDKDLAYIKQLQFRLYTKEIRCNLGIIGDNFVIAEFFREPIRLRERGNTEVREFALRLLHSPLEGPVSDYRKGDDIFFFGDEQPPHVNVTDVNSFQLGVTTFAELEYILSLRKTYE